MRYQGHPDVPSYGCFVNEAEKTARAVIDSETAPAWIGHHEIAMGWPEISGLHGVAILSEVMFRRPLAPEIQNCIDNSKLTARVHHGTGFAADLNGRTVKKSGV